MKCRKCLITFKYLNQNLIVPIIDEETERKKKPKLNPPSDINVFMKIKSKVNQRASFLCFVPFHGVDGGAGSKPVG